MPTGDATSVSGVNPTQETEATTTVAVHDHFNVVVNVIVPRRLSEEQRELLEQLNGTLTDENLRSEESMFAKLRRALGSQAA